MSSYGRASVPSLKTEDGRVVVSGEQAMKPEPGFATAPLDEDIYEDAGDLDFADAAQALYLTRLPKYLWKTWSQLEDDQEIQVGTIRVEGGLQKPQRMSLMLSPAAPINKTVPKEYNMQITNATSSNIFVFTEKDFPGYNTRSRVTARTGTEDASLPFSQAPPRILLQDRVKDSKPKIDKGKRYNSRYRKAIPKKTSFAGQVRTEINCLPVENEDYKRIMAERAQKELKPVRETQMLGVRASAHAGNVMNSGSLGRPASFSSFIKPTGTNRAKGHDLKAARIPQNELLDLIFECFKKYNYWSLKSLKAEVDQPEAYLRQTLELVAQLIRQGPHAMTWQLKPGAKMSSYADVQEFNSAKDSHAPDAVTSFDGASDIGDGAGSEDDEGSMRMEDVIPT